MGVEERLSPRSRRIVAVTLHFAVAGILLIAWLPTAYWILPLVAAIRVRLWQGWWPYYGHPDPKDLPQHFGAVPEWTEFAVPIASLAAFAALSVWIMRRALRRRWWLWTSVIAWPLAWALAYALMLADPGGVIDWFFD